MFMQSSEQCNGSLGLGLSFTTRLCNAWLQARHVWPLKRFLKSGLAFRLKCFNEEHALPKRRPHMQHHGPCMSELHIMVWLVQVKIFVPVRNPEQSGLSKAIDGPGKGPLWRMEIDNRQK